MKLLVFSDSHGYADNILRAIEKEKPALCFFLGDGADDLKKLAQRFPDLPVQAVRGNCDLRAALPKMLVCAVGGVKIFAAHGHLYNVKYDPRLHELCSAAEKAGAQIALFGHTHEAFHDRIGGVEVLNPGTVGRVSRPGYGVIDISEGAVTLSLHYLKPED